jgi:hypothetical protein
MLGASWPDRGARSDDAIRALRASLSKTQPSYDGKYYRYGSVVVEPCAVQPRVPIWVGGRTPRSLRRAVELADGWIPFGLRGSDIARMLAGFELTPGFEVVLSAGPLDPSANAADAVRQLRKLADLGATAVTCSVTATSADHYCDQIAALRALSDDIEKERV